MQSDTFYDDLALVSEFAQLAEPNRFSPVPNDWVVGVADIVNSTGEIERGRYKAVNMVGAAVVSAMSNALQGRAFPFVFGGDGASFAVPAEHAETARKVMAELRRWSEDEFGLALRAAIVPVSEIRATGVDLRVARFAASEGVDYAMFSGRGLAWAEAQMKAGRFMVPQSDPGALPDLTGLSCRWSNSPSVNGQILSLVVLPTAQASERDFADLASRLISACADLERSGHPVPIMGPGVRWPPPGLDLDAHVSRKRKSFQLHRLQLLAQNLLIWGLFKAGVKVGEFVPKHYAQMVSKNADFRKFDDGLKMTLDCDAQTRTRLEHILDQARKEGKIRYGLYGQDEAMMTCFVPSAVRDNHVHFIDGASGGYTRAAANLT